MQWANQITYGFQQLPTMHRNIFWDISAKARALQTPRELQPPPCHSAAEMPEKLFCVKLCFMQNKEKSRCDPDKWSACSFHFFTARILPGHSGQKGFPYNIPVPQQYRVPYVLQGSYLRYGTESDFSHAAALPAHRHP